MKDLEIQELLAKNRREKNNGFRPEEEKGVKGHYGACKVGPATHIILNDPCPGASEDIMKI